MVCVQLTCAHWRSAMHHVHHHTARHLLWLALTLCFAPKVVNAQSLCGSAPIPPAAQAFDASCNSKTTCLLEESLQIKPLRPNVLIKKVGIAFCGGQLVVYSDALLDLQEKNQARSDTLTYPLAALATRALQSGHASSTALQQLFEKAGPSRKISLTVKIESTEENVAEQHTLLLDLAPLWASGMLKPVIATATCGPANEPCEMGDTLTLAVPDLPTWLPLTKTDPSKLRLVVGGLALPGLPKVQLHGPSPGLLFVLDRGVSPSEGIDPWTLLIKQRRHSSSNMAVALANEQTTVSSMANAPDIALAAPGLAPYFLPLLAAILCIPVISLLDLNVLRDPAPVPELRDKMTFSLGRTQMLLWTVLVIGGWLFLYLTTKVLWSINDTALVLMGISGATAIGASSAGEFPAAVKTLVTEHQAAKQAGMPGAPAARPLAAIEADLLAIVGASKGWLRDITSDNGLDTGLHRVQNLTFTLVLGIAFIVTVVTNLAMPAFPATALTLLGISGGAYVGFKFAAR